MSLQPGVSAGTVVTQNYCEGKGSGLSGTFWGEYNDEGSAYITETKNVYANFGAYVTANANASNNTGHITFTNNWGSSASPGLTAQATRSRATSKSTETPSPRMPRRSSTPPVSRRPTPISRPIPETHRSRRTTVMHDNRRVGRAWRFRAPIYLSVVLLLGAVACSPSSGGSGAGVPGAVGRPRAAAPPPRRRAGWRRDPDRRYDRLRGRDWCRRHHWTWRQRRPRVGQRARVARRVRAARRLGRRGRHGRRDGLRAGDRFGRQRGQRRL